MVRDSSSAVRILIVTDDLGGGTGNHLLSVAKHLASPSRDVRIVSRVAQNPPERVTPTGPVEVLSRPPWLDVYPFGQVWRFRQLSRCVARVAPDIIHTYFFWPIVYGRILKRLGRVRVLVENREDEGFNWGRNEYALLRWTRSLPDRVICVSDAVGRAVREKEGLDPSRIAVIRNGVDATNGALSARSTIRRQLGLTHDQLVVGMVANLNRAVKGASYFLEAIPVILQRVPQARFLVIGSNPHESALRQHTKALGIDAYVMFVGFHKDISPWYAALDVSVLTSLSEGLSLTLLESMDHGLPVVATSVGGNPEVVVDGETGFLVPPAQTEAFANRVVQLLRDADLRARMGHAGRLRIERQFRLPGVASRYLDVYHDLLSCAPQARRSDCAAAARG